MDSYAYDPAAYFTNLMLEKLCIEEEGDIVDFAFMALKPLSKSSSGQLVSLGIAIASSNKQIKIYDIYGNELVMLEVPKEIKKLATSPHQEDMFVAVLTVDNYLYEFDVRLDRKGKKKTDRRRNLSNDEDD